MSAALQTPLILLAWLAVLLVAVVGYWFLREHQLLHKLLGLVAVMVGLYLLARVRELVIMLIIAGVVAFILGHLVDRLSRRMSRGLAIALVYLGLIVVLAVLGTIFVPIVVAQARQLIGDLPRYTADARDFAGRVTTWYGAAPESVRSAIDSGIEHARAASASVTTAVERLLLEMLGWGIRGILMLILSIYLLMDEKSLHQAFLRLFPERMRAEVEKASGEVSETFANYLRGQLTVICFVAISVTVLLVVCRIPYAVFIGFLAGVLEVIPYFGAIAGAVPAVALGFMKSPGVGVALIIGFVIINQVEGHVVLPWVMGKHLEMRPLTILVALLAGEMMAGVVGMIVAVPVVSLVRALVPYIVRHYRELQVVEGQGEEGAPEDAAVAVTEGVGHKT